MHHFQLASYCVPEIISYESTSVKSCWVRLPQLFFLWHGTWDWQGEMRSGTIEDVCLSVGWKWIFKRVLSTLKNKSDLCWNCLVTYVCKKADNYPVKIVKANQKMLKIDSRKGESDWRAFWLGVYMKKLYFLFFKKSSPLLSIKCHSSEWWL